MPKARGFIPRCPWVSAAMASSVFGPGARFSPRKQAHPQPTNQAVPHLWRGPLRWR